MSTMNPNHTTDEAQLDLDTDDVDTDREGAAREILALVDANDGAIPQPDVVETLDWAQPTISRAAIRLEEDGVIDRVHRSRHERKTLVICRPEKMPVDTGVLQLLEDNGGWIHQNEAAKALDWSRSHISRTVDALEAEDRVVRTQRLTDSHRNIIAFPGEEPPGTPEAIAADDPDPEPEPEPDPSWRKFYPASNGGVADD